MNRTATIIPALIAALSLSGAATAQTALHHHTLPAKTTEGRKRVNAIVNRQQATWAASHAPAQRTTATASERLIASSQYNMDPMFGAIGIQDSIRLKYSGEHGSKYNKDVMNFMNPDGQYFTYSYPLSVMVGGESHTSTNQAYPADVLADTVYQWNNNVPDGMGGYTYGLDNFSYFVYDGNNNITFCHDQYIPADTTAPRTRFINTYDASNNILKSLELYYASPTWDTASYMGYAYDASHHLVADSSFFSAGLGTWAPNFKDIYSYDGAGNIIAAANMQDSSGTWVESLRYNFTYNTDNSLRTDSISYYSGALWSPEILDSLGYTAGADYFTQLNETYYDPSGNEKIVVTKHVAASGLPDTLRFFEYDGTGTIVYGGRADYTYDSYGNPVIANQYAYDMTADSFLTASSATNHFYYEPYSITTAVNDVAAAQEAISIFPNPASGQVTISRPSVARGAITTVRFTNAAGQLIRTESLPWMNEAESFSVADFAPGIYFITLQDKSGKLLTTQKIIKQ